MEDIEKTKKRRKAHRGVVTRILNKVNAQLNESPESLTNGKLRQYGTELREKKEVLKNLDEAIFDLMIEENLDDEICENEATEASEVSEKIGFCLNSIEAALNEIDCDVNSGRSVHGMSRSGSVESVASMKSSLAGDGTCGRKVKLPKLELKKFSGKIAEWQEFWDSFRSSIHSDEQLAKVDKFKYLRSYLEEPAKGVVSGFSLTDADYDAALELLKKRYAKPGVIKRAHLNDLINLAPVYSEKNVQRLRTLHDQIETRFRAMEAQGIDQQSYSSVIVPVLMGKIPEMIRNNMIRFGSNHMEWNLDDMLAALGKELEVLEGHVPILQQGQSGGGRRSDQQIRPKFSEQKPTTASALLAGNDPKTKCAFCLGEHNSESCESHKKPEERKKILIKYGKCFSCLKPGHRSFKCRNKTSCKHCKQGNHHFSICPDNNASLSKEAHPGPNVPQLSAEAASWVGNTGSEGRVALQTALAVIDGKSDRMVRVLFDTGSHKTFITSKAIGKLELKPVRKEKLGIKAFGSKETDVAERDVVKISVSGKEGEKSVEIEAYVVEDISSIPNIHIETVKKDFAHLNNVWFADVCRYNDTLEIDCLIGSDYLWAFQEDETIRGGPGEPVAVKTSLGWVLSGPLKGKTTSDSVNTFNVNFVAETHTNHKEIDSNLHKLWDLDSLGIREGDPVQETVLDNITFNGSRYSVGLPWKVGHKTLPSNYNVSQMRLNSQVRKLKENPEVLKRYDDIISEQVSEDIIEQVSELETVNKVHYLPHRAVVRESAETTKVRIVYDASSKDRKAGVSLNDCLHVGPSLTPMIFDVLLRFRSNPVALVGDIEKAFLNIEIHPQDRDCLRFLWFKDVNAKEPEVVVYRFKRVIFGCNSSPFLLNCTLQHHISKYKEIDPEFSAKLVRSFFVDDLVTSCKNSEAAHELYSKSKDRMGEGGFTLRKWKTNNFSLAERIGQGQPKVVAAKEENSYVEETLGIGDSRNGKTKVLGLTWDNQKDVIEFELDNIGKEVNSTSHPTKRSILSILASLFDPLGLTSPVAVIAKIIFQELCLKKLNWDDPLPKEECTRWEAWLHDLLETKTLTVDRCMVKAEDITSCELHGFADASQKAYCAMVYLVYKTKKGIHCSLVSAKTRVAPLKKLTIPRLELMSARVLATLMKTVLDAIGTEIKIDQVKYWLDSKTALYWINNNGEWKQFVQHRVNEILKLSKKEDWGHVAGVENPADLGSRGVTASYLKNNKLWWEGPEWLRKGRNCWPNNFCPYNSSDVDAERKKTNVMLTVEQEVVGMSRVLEIERYSSLLKLLRVTAYVLRFVENLKKKKAGKQCILSSINAEEIEAAERAWILEVQKNMQQDASFEKTAQQLGVQIDNGILVCKGRLSESDLDFRSKYPMILPKNNPLTDLIIFDCHVRAHHNKVRSTLTELRSRFWVPQGRQQVKKVVNQCQICKKLEGKAFQGPPVADLPSFRVTESRPFANIGVDFAGPLYVKAKKGEMSKVYICLFTCCVTRALHLELVNDLNATSFLNCFKRFCSRRGTPSLVNSDNAKTFKAAAKLLAKVSTDDNFQAYQQSHRIKWNFNLPRSPWWGGYFERMVGSVKRCLRKVLGNARLNQDELSTVLTEIENTLNTRPLTYLYDELEEVLTPSHLIHGYRLSSLAESTSLKENFIDSSKDILSKRFLYLRRQLSHFWNRWRKEYLVDLRELHKLNKNKPSKISKGDLVLLYEDNVKRAFWKVGIIEDLVIGKDGQCRGAVVRKSGKGKSERLTRPLQKLFPLEISSKQFERNTGAEKVTVNEEANESEEKERERENDESEEERCTGSRPIRAAAKDARWKSQLMLDP